MDARFDSTINSLYRAAERPEYWPEALQMLADCFRDIGAMLVLRLSSGKIETLFSSGLNQIQAEYDREWRHRDPRHDYRSAPDGKMSSRIWTDRQVFSPQEIAELPIYQEFLVRRGLGFFAAAALLPGETATAVISVQRGTNKPEFREDELRLLARLACHVERALTHWRALAEARLQHQILLKVLDKMSLDRFGLDADGRIILANKFLERVQETGVSIADGKTRVDDPSLSKDFWLTDPRLALVIRDDSLDADDLRRLFGLTLAEAKIAKLIANGLSPKLAAEQLGLSPTTVRTTLKRVFSKAQVSRQSELAALVARRARDVGKKL